MSKLTKLVRDPAKFFQDTKIVKAVKGTNILPQQLNEPNMVIKKGQEPVDKKKPNIQPISAPTFVLEKQWNELLTLEDIVDVNAFELDGVNIWPVVRYIVWMKLWYISRSLKKAATFNPFAIDIPKRTYDFYKTLGAINPRQLNDRADFLFYINPNGSDRTEIFGEIHNRIIDPIYESMLEKGYNCIKVCAIRSVSNRAFENYHHSPCYLIPDRIRSTGYTDDLNIPYGFDTQLASSLKSIRVTTDDVLSAINSYYDQVNFFSQVLSKIKPKAVFFINMGTQMPLTHAARQIGIATIELQHGVQQANTPIYKTWKYFLNTKRYLSYPTHFGVWGEDEANYIRKEYRNTIEPLVLGYQWLTSNSVSYTDDRMMNSLKQKVESYPLVVTVTMQNQDKLPQEILDVIEKFGDKVAWLIRLHPKWNKIVTNQKLPSNVITDKEVQRLTLRELFKLSDLHLTRDSASVYEATFEGVRSYIYSDKGKKAFEGLINAGIVSDYHALNHDLQSALNALLELSDDTYKMDANKDKIKREYFEFDTAFAKFAIDNESIDNELERLITWSESQS